jgi:flagellar hook-basal body complex protein FliE
MEISPVTATQWRSPVSAVKAGNVSSAGKSAEAIEAFQKTLSDAVGGLQASQTQANASLSQLATGENVDLHDVMLSMQQANLSFQLVLQARNKLVEAYQEVMRLQV